MAFLLPSVPDTLSEGPRLETLQVQDSAFGEPIPKGFGTIRLAAHIIWALDLREEQVTEQQSVGGKGGGGGTATVRSYRYYGTFAACFGEGEASSILRLWGDKKPIYNNRSGQDRLLRTGWDFQFYMGSEDQNPAAALRQEEGADNAPAFRGLVYAVFRDVPLEDFGNRLPSIEAEINFEATTQTDPEKTTGTSGNLSTTGSGQWAYDYGLDLGYCVTAGTGEGLGIQWFDLATLTKRGELILNASDDFSSDDSIQIEGINRWTHDVQVTLYYDQIVVIFSFEQQVIVNPFGAVGTYYTSRSENRTPDAETSGYAIGYFQSVGVRLTAGPVVVDGWISRGLDEQTGDGSGWEYRVHKRTGEHDVDVQVPLTVPAGSVIAGDLQDMYEGAGSVITAQTNETADSLEIVTLRGYPTLGGDGEYILGMYEESLGTFSVSSITGDSSHTSISVPLGGVIMPVIFDPEARVLIVGFSVNGSDSLQYMAGFSADALGETARHIWTTKVGDIPHEDRTVFTFDELRYSQQHNLNGTYFGWTNGGGDVYLINVNTGEFVGGYDGSTFSGLSLDNTSNFDANRLALFYMPIGSTGSARFDRLDYGFQDGNDTTVAAVVSYVADRVGIPSAKLDVTEIEDDALPGYVLDDNMSGFKAIEPLTKFYAFDMVSIDGVWTAVHRGEAATFTLNEADLVVTDPDRQNQYEETFRLEDEIPRGVSITFFDKANKFEQGNVAFARPNTAETAVNADEIENLDFPISMRATRAKRGAINLTYQAWNERSEVEGLGPPEMMLQTAGDVGTFTRLDGVQYRVRIDTIEIGADNTVELSLTREGAAVEGAPADDLADGVFGDPGVIGGEGKTIEAEVYTVSDTKLFMLDIPALEDLQLPNGAGNPLVYWAGYNFGVGAWPGANLFRATDGVNYSNVSREATGTPWGFVNAAYPAWDGKTWGRDDTNDLTVSIFAHADEVESVTETEVFEGANKVAIINGSGEVEIIQFETFSGPDSAGNYTLSGIYRARRGTTDFAGAHAVGEEVVFLLGNGGEYFEDLPANVGSTFIYRPVTIGQAFENAGGVVVSYSFSGFNQYPWSPTRLRGSPSGFLGDIVFAWDRRSRLGSAFNFSTDAPLDEASILFDYELYDEEGGTLLASASDVSAATFTYTAAAQQTDNTTGRDTFFLRVWQIGASIQGGDQGFVGECDVTVIGRVKADPGPRDYWRVLVDTTNGGGGDVQVAELEFRPYPGDDDQATGGTALASGDDATNVAAGAFADDAGTSYWQSAAGAGPHWIGYNFASPVDVGGIALSSRGDVDREVFEFRLQYSDDGVTWYDAANYSSGHWDGSSVSEQTFDTPWRPYLQVKPAKSGSFNSSNPTDATPYGRSYQITGGADEIVYALDVYDISTVFDIGFANQQIRVPDDDQLTIGTKPFAIRVIASFGFVSEDFQTLVSHYTTSGNSRSMILDHGTTISGNSRIRFVYSSDGVSTGSFTADFSPIYSDDHYYEIVVERDEADVFRMFIDGVLVEESAAFTTDFLNTTADFMIGVIESNQGEHRGRIADFEFFVGRPYYGATINPISKPGTGFELSKQNFSYITLNFDGSDGSTTITDEAGTVSWTASGDAEIDTGESVFGGSSLVIPGTGGHLLGDQGLTLSDRAFTFETFVRFASGASGDMALLSNWEESGDLRAFQIVADASAGEIKFIYSTDGTAGTVSTITATATLSAETWYHLCVERDPAGAIRFYVDGVLRSKQTIGQSTTVSTTDDVMRIGIASNSGAINQFEGHIDALSLVIGKALFVNGAGLPSYRRPAIHF